MAGIRLSSLMPTKQKLTVLHPSTGEPTPLVLTLVSEESEAYINRLHDWLEQEDTVTDRNPTTREQWKNLAQKASFHIDGWEGMLDDNDQPVPYSPEKALDLMVNPATYGIRRQVEGFAKERSNFFRPVQEPAPASGKSKRKA